MPSGVRLPHPFATHGETEQIKNQKILNGAGHSWSQIFMKLSEHVKVVTLSNYSTLFFSQHTRLPWQPDTKILAFRSAKRQPEFAKNQCFFYFIHAKLCLFLLFSIQVMKETTWTKRFCIIITKYILFPYHHGNVM